jgi:hypothetical protein
MSLRDTSTVPFDSHFFHPWAELQVPDNQLYIYKGEDWEGDDWNLQFDMSDKERDYYFQLKGTGFNNEISSWKLGRNIWAEFCKDDLEWDPTATLEDPVFRCPGGGQEERTTTVTDWYDSVEYVKGIGYESPDDWYSFDDIDFVKELYATTEEPHLMYLDFYFTDQSIHGIQQSWGNGVSAPLHKSS